MYTSGPWEARQHHIWTQDANVHIAQIIRAPDGDWSPANARLIAAAPDLLAALEAMTDRFEEALAATHATRTDRQEIKEARKLVAKAKDGKE